MITVGLVLLWIQDHSLLIAINQIIKPDQDCDRLLTVIISR